MVIPVATSAARAPRSPSTAIGTMMAINTELAMVLIKLSTRGLMRTNDISNTPPKRVTKARTVMLAISASTPAEVVSIVPRHRLARTCLGLQPEQPDQAASQRPHHHVHVRRQPFPGRQRTGRCHQPGHQNPG